MNVLDFNDMFYTFKMNSKLGANMVKPELKIGNKLTLNGILQKYEISQDRKALRIKIGERLVWKIRWKIFRNNR